MQNYIIMTDSGCDLSAEMLKRLNVACIPFFYRFEDDDRDYIEHPLSLKEFYDKMRAGGVARTAAINCDDFMRAMTPYLDAGQDIIFVAFSSGLSTSFQSLHLAVGELAEKYPERRIFALDTRSASVGEGLYVHLAARKRDEGASFDELASYLAGLMPRLSHWFTVDDLMYLKRGGRISGASAIVGNTLSIKPILHVDIDGHLITKVKVAGRKQSMRTIASKFKELAEDPQHGDYIIGHSDCPEDAEKLREAMVESTGREPLDICMIGTIIGAHVGPGMLAVVFVGER